MQLIKSITALALLIVVQAHFYFARAQVIVSDSPLDTIFNNAVDGFDFELAPLRNSYFDIRVIGSSNVSILNLVPDSLVEVISSELNQLGMYKSITVWVPGGLTQRASFDNVSLGTSLSIEPRAYPCDLGLVIDTANTIIQNIELINTGFPFRVKNYGFTDCVLRDTLLINRSIQFDTLSSTYLNRSYRSFNYINSDPDFVRVCLPKGVEHIISDFSLRGNNRLFGSFSSSQTEWAVNFSNSQNSKNDTLREPYFEHPKNTALFSSSYGAPSGWLNASKDTLVGQYISVSTGKWPLRELTTRVKGGSVGDSLVVYYYKQDAKFSSVPLDTGNFRFPIHPFIGSDTNFLASFGPLPLITTQDRYRTLPVNGVPINLTSTGDGLYLLEHLKRDPAGPDLYVAYDDLSGTNLEWQAMGMAPDSSWVSLDGKIPFLQPTFSDARTELEGNFGPLFYKHDLIFDGRDLNEDDRVLMVRRTDNIQVNIDTTVLVNLGGGLFRGTDWWPDMERVRYRVSVNDEFETLTDTDCWIINLQGDRYRQWQTGATQDTLSAFSYNSCELVELPGRSCTNPYVLDSLFGASSAQSVNIDTRLGLQADPQANLELLSQEIGVVQGNDYGINFNGGGRWLEFSPSQSGRYVLNLVGQPDSLLQGGIPKAGIALFTGTACEAVTSTTPLWTAGAIGLDTITARIYLHADSVYSAYVIDQHKLGSRLNFGARYLGVDTCRSSTYEYPAVDTLICMGDSLTLFPGIGTSACLDYNNTSWLSFSGKPDSAVFFKDDTSLVRLWSHGKFLDPLSLVAGDDLNPGVYYFQGVSWAGTHSPWLQRIRNEEDGCSWRGETIKVEVSDPSPLDFTIDYVADSIFVSILGGSGSAAVTWADGVQGARRSAFSDSTAVSFVISDSNRCVDEVSGTATTMVSATERPLDHFGLSIFPNPSQSGKLQVVASEPLHRISIYNSIGQLEHQVQTVSSNSEILLPSKGLYQVEVLTQTGKRQIRAVVMLGQ